jgi:hypothetical protein
MDHCESFRKVVTGKFDVDWCKQNRYCTATTALYTSQIWDTALHQGASKLQVNQGVIICIRLPAGGKGDINCTCNPKQIGSTSAGDETELALVAC